MDKCPKCNGNLEDNPHSGLTPMTYLKCGNCGEKFQKSRYNGGYILTELGK